MKTLARKWCLAKVELSILLKNNKSPPLPTLDHDLNKN